MGSLRSRRDSLLRLVTRNAELQLAYLRSDTVGLARLREALLAEELILALDARSSSSEGMVRPPLPRVVLDSSQILELDSGRVSDVFGPDYSDLDDRLTRSRPPSPPLLFVSRVLRLDSRKGQLEPFVIEWEYDIPRTGLYVTNGEITSLIVTESSHAVLLGFLHIGVDLLMPETVRYRLTDSAHTFVGELPRGGATIRGVARVTSFARLAKGLLCHFEYDCYEGERQIIHSNIHSGFFPDSSLAGSTRALSKSALSLGPRIERKETRGEASPFFVEPEHECSKRSFSEEDLAALIEGDLDRCFGTAYGSGTRLPLCSPDLRMVSRIRRVDPQGGRFGLGEVLAEYDLSPDLWAYACHFRNDPVLPGVLIAEGFTQIAGFTLCFLGAHRGLGPCRRSPIFGLTTRVRFRGAVPPGKGVLEYRFTVKEIRREPSPSIRYQVEVSHEGRIITMCEDGGMRLVPTGIDRRATEVAPR